MQKMGKYLMALSDECEQIRAEIELVASQNDGEVPDALLDAIAEKQLETLDKLDGLLDYVDSIKSTLDIAKERIDRFKAKKKSLENLQERIRQNINRYMFKNDLKQIKCSRTISLVNQDDLIEYDEKLIPEQFKKKTTRTETVTITETEIDKESIAKLLAEGKEVIGVTVTKNRSYIKVK